MRRRQGASRVLLQRSLLVLIIVLILIALFLDRSRELSRQVQETARQQVIARLNVALAVRLLQAMSSGHLQSLAALDRANPFEALADDRNYRPPADYRGRWPGGQPPQQAGWYFDERKQAIVWFDGAHWLPESWQLRLRFEDRNGNGRFDAGQERIEGLSMKKAAD